MALVRVIQGQLVQNDDSGLVRVFRGGLVQEDDAVAGGGPITTSFDAALQKSITKTTSFDGVLLKNLLLTSNFDSVLQKAIEQTVNIDSVLQKQEIISAVLDAHLTSSSGGAVSISMDSVLLLQDVIKTTVLDSILQKQVNVSIVLDAVVSKLLSITTSIDAHLITSGTSVFTLLDTAILKLSLNKNVSLDSVLALIGTWVEVEKATSTWVDIPNVSNTWTTIN